MMEQSSINNSNNIEQVKRINAEIQILDMKKKQLQHELKTIQNNCSHDFVETELMRKCRKCKWTESVYY
ncbi:hypothetical protein [Anaerobacillus alkalidiazotrophicus]|nr:hypothetical protein [Anaerobacillus alkalidiazotrophicus]